MNVEAKELQSLIKNGEKQNVVFVDQFRDNSEVARSMAALANTNGGMLLLGVRHTSSIPGIEAQTALETIKKIAKELCQPAIKYTSETIKIEEQSVVVIKVEESEKKPHSAPNENDEATFFLRADRQNVLANRIMTEVWKLQRQNKRTMLKVGYTENKLFDYLERNGHIVFSRFCGMANISPKKAEKILIHLIYMKVIEPIFTEQTIFYQMAEPDRPEPNSDVVLGDF